MKEIKLRCHFSTIFESLWQFWVVIVFMLLNQIDTIIDVVKDIGSDGIKSLVSTGGIWGLAGLLVLTACVLIFQFLRWRKTWVILDDNLIIIERNTLRKVKNTIAIENISAVNMERNLFERLVGTYRIKIDTNSMTTANETDISIVFREDIAIAFRKTVIERMSALKGSGTGKALSEERQPDELYKAASEGKKIFASSPKDMLAHAFYDMPMFSLIIALAGICGSVWYIGNMGFTAFIRDAFGGFIAVVIMVLTAIYNIAKRFIKYYNFTVYRDGKDVHVRCGLIKLRSYTIPVDKITALQIEQQPFSRIFKRYNVKVVTVGVGDEDGESSNLTMSLPEEKLKEQLQELVPEYSWADIAKVIKEEKKGMTVRLVKSVKWHLAAAAGIIVAVVLHGPWWAAAVPAVMDAYINLLYIMSHKAAGYMALDEGMILSGGFFAKHQTICTYKKMQILNISYHPAAAHLGIVDGVIMLLNSSAGLPYIKRDLAIEITNRIIGGQK